MRPKRAVAAIAAAVALAWGSAQAAPDAATSIPEAPYIIILEAQPIEPGAGPEAERDREQALLGLLLLQLLGAVPGEGEAVELQPVAPSLGTSI